METGSLASGGARAKARMALRAAPLLLLGVCAPAIRAQAPDDSDGDTVPDALEARLGLDPGDYRFHIASDDQGQLRPGTTVPGSPCPASSKFSRRLAARVDGYTGCRAWTATAARAGPVVALARGETIHIEVLMKESNGLDNLSAGRTRPHIDGLADTATPGVVPGFVIAGGRKAVVLASCTPDPLDADDDGLLDSWEDGAGLNPGDDGSFNPAGGGYSGRDNDGLANHGEWLAWGDPPAAGGNTGLVRRDIWTKDHGPGGGPAGLQRQLPGTGQRLAVGAAGLAFLRILRRQLRAAAAPLRGAPLDREMAVPDRLGRRPGTPGLADRVPPGQGAARPCGGLDQRAGLRHFPGPGIRGHGSGNGAPGGNGGRPRRDVPPGGGQGGGLAAEGPGDGPAVAGGGAACRTTGRGRGLPWGAMRRAAPGRGSPRTTAERSRGIARTMASGNPKHG